MSELKNGVMLIENALRCVAQDIELYYKKKAPNGAWCIATCRNAAAQFEQMRSELAELRRAQPENEAIVHCAECEHYTPSPMGGNGCLIRFNGRTEIIPRNPTDYCSYCKRKPERSEG